jgi:hypothetical protein
MGDDDAFLYYHSHYYIKYFKATFSFVKRVENNSKRHETFHILKQPFLL